VLAAVPDKITTGHQERQAYVYVRQSTTKQVRENVPSRENQYALIERAAALGWPEGASAS
jgi:hypothetical protein